MGAMLAYKSIRYGRFQLAMCGKAEPSTELKVKTPPAAKVASGGQTAGKIG